MTTSLIGAVLAAALALGTGCSKKDGDKAPEPTANGAAVASAAPAAPAKPAATCQTAADHAMDLTMHSDAWTKSTPEQKKTAEKMMDGLKDEIVKDCTENKWDAKRLDCVMAATVMDDMVKCDTST